MVSDTDMLYRDTGPRWGLSECGKHQRTGSGYFVAPPALPAPPPLSEPPTPDPTPPLPDALLGLLSPLALVPHVRFVSVGEADLAGRVGRLCKPRRKGLVLTPRGGGRGEVSSGGDW